MHTCTTLTHSRFQHPNIIRLLRYTSSQASSTTHIHMHTYIHIRTHTHTHSRFQHPNIIRLLGYTSSQASSTTHICLVYEMGSRGSVASILRDDTKARLFTWRDRVHVAHGMLCALNYLHCHQPDNPVYHRDVKHILTPKYLMPSLRSTRWAWCCSSCWWGRCRVRGYRCTACT